MSDKLKSLSVLLLLSLIWGTTWLADAVIAAPDSPLRLLYSRYLFAAVCIALPVLASRFRKPRNLQQGVRQQIPVSITLGITMFAAPSLLLQWAAQHGVAPWIPLLYAGLPLALSLAAGEPRAPAILGLGAMLVLLNGTFPLVPAKLPWTIPILGAVGLQGWSLLYARRHLAITTTLPSIMVQFLVAGWLLETASLLSSQPRLPPLCSWALAPLAAFSALVLLATAAAYPLYYRLLRHLQPAQVATSLWLQTLVTVAESACIFRQRPGWRMATATAALIACATLLLRDEPASPELRLQ